MTPFKKAILKLMVILTIIILMLFTVKQILYSNSSTVCGVIYGRHKGSRGGWYIDYKFEINNKKYLRSQDSWDCKDVSIEIMKKMNCIKIEYSNFWNGYSKIIDRRIVE
jgi:hypothetical protein